MCDDPLVSEDPVVSLVECVSLPLVPCEVEPPRIWDLLIPVEVPVVSEVPCVSLPLVPCEVEPPRMWERLDVSAEPAVSEVPEVSLALVPSVSALPDVVLLPLVSLREAV